MPPILPRPADRSRIVPLVAGLLVLAATMVPPPVAAASSLGNPGASPPSGTTDTIFVFSVDYVTDSAHAATEVTVEIVGLGGSPLPMQLVAGTELAGTWQSNPTMLPQGSWDLVFSGVNQGPQPQQPADIAGPTVVVNAAPTPTPTPSATPAGQTPPPTSTPAPSPPATATPRATPSPIVTPSPTPLPPGVTATPTPTAQPPASASAPTPPGVAPPAPASAAGEPSERGTASPGTRAATVSPTPSASTGADGAGGSGWGQAGWIALGGVTSAAGAAVLLRQWRAARRTTSGVG